jgi:exonuclease I
MSETSGTTATDSIDVQELAEIIAELEQYRERLFNETLETAQRAKLMKSAALARLEPELAQIDATLQELRSRQAALAISN